jgi:hypothetical protein
MLGKSQHLRHDGTMDAAKGGIPRESRRAMVRSTRILLTALGALAVAGLALTGCASSAGGPSSGSPSIAPDPDLGAAWLDSGRMVGLVTLGSSTCVPGIEDEAEVDDDGVLQVELAMPKASQPCTADLVPRVTFVDLPDGVDPDADLEIEVTGDEYYGLVQLDGVAGLDPSGETDYQPSAGWATAPNQFVILTWGSSTCLPQMEDIAATAPAEVTVSYVTPAADEVCTLDMVPQGAVAAVTGLEEDSGVELVLAGGTFEGLRVPIYGTN